MTEKGVFGLLAKPITNFYGIHEAAAKIPPAPL
jgi:hypothetical protein